MSGIKKIISAVLVCAMVFSGVTYSGSTETYGDTLNSSDWTDSAITAPEEGKLIGAGYIDIKWNNNLEDAASYKVYFDGDLAGTVTATDDDTLSVEVYTTSVSSHTAYVIATLDDGTTVKSDTRTFYVTKKGLCVNEEMGAALDPSDLNVGWYYNWGYKSFAESTSFSNDAFDDLEYVPMIWGTGVVFGTALESIEEQGYKYLLGYNEPDLTAESNLTVSAVYSRWSQFCETGLRLGSPAVSVFPTWSTDWWDPFWTKISASSTLDFDFIAIHDYQQYYDGTITAQQYLEAVDECWETYHKPIWITEFAFWNFDKSDAEGCAKVEEFMKIVIKGLNEREYVERYAWFCPDYEETAASSSSIYVYETGEITSIGKIYAELGNPDGYDATTYGVDVSTSVDTSAKACINAMTTTLYTAKAAKKKVKYNIKSISKASGYQVQISTKKAMSNGSTTTVSSTTGNVKYTSKVKKLINKQIKTKTAAKKKKLKKQLKKKLKKAKTAAQKKKLRKQYKKKIKNITVKVVLYVRARGVKTFESNTYYTSWSDVTKTSYKS